MSHKATPHHQRSRPMIREPRLMQARVSLQMIVAVEQPIEDAPDVDPGAKGGRGGDADMAQRPDQDEVADQG
jgi:hypothetical protein